jgi:hypothetical protein
MGLTVHQNIARALVFQGSQAHIAGAFADVLLLAHDGAQFKAHRLILCGASGWVALTAGRQAGLRCPCSHDDGVMVMLSHRYFRSLLLGAGTRMREGSQHELPGSPGSSPHQVVPLSFTGAELEEVLTAIYELQVQVSGPRCRAPVGGCMLSCHIHCQFVHWQVGPDSLERLLHAASYLDMPALVDACAAYMRSLLSLTTAVPLLRLANRYGILPLRAELVRTHSLLLYPSSVLFPPLGCLHSFNPPWPHACPQLQYVSVKFSSLLGAPVAGQPNISNGVQQSGSTAVMQAEQGGVVTPCSTPTSPLADLSKDLLLEILLCDELAVDCVSD